MRQMVRTHLADLQTEPLFIGVRISGIYNQGPGRFTKFMVQMQEPTFRGEYLTEVWTTKANVSVVNL